MELGNFSVSLWTGAAIARFQVTCFVQRSSNCAAQQRDR